MNTKELALKLKAEALSHGCTNPKLHVLHGGPHHSALDDGAFDSGEFEEIVPFMDDKLESIYLSCRSRCGEHDLFFSQNPNREYIPCTTNAPFKWWDGPYEPIAQKVHDMMVNGPQPNNPEHRKLLHAYRVGMSCGDGSLKEILVVSCDMTTALVESAKFTSKDQLVDNIQHLGLVEILVIPQN